MTCPTYGAGAAESGTSSLQSPSPAPDLLDAVFGEETRDTPPLRWMPGHITYPWVTLFDGPKPEWYVDPLTPVCGSKLTASSGWGGMLM